MSVSPAQIRAARAELDVTQRQLAKAAGIHPRTIKMVERGNVSPQAATWHGIAKAFTAAGVRFLSDGCTVILPQATGASPSFR